MTRLIELSRRGLLRAGLAGSLGALAACGTPERPARKTASRAALTPAAEEILVAVIPVVGASLLADETVRRQVLEGGVAAVDAYLASLSTPLRNEALGAFAVLDWAPVRIVLLHSPRRWSEADPGSIEAFLDSARESRFEILRRIAVLLQSLAGLAIFDEPLVWRQIGYPGPPVVGFPESGASG